MPKLFDSSLSHHLRYPLWVYAVPVVVFAALPAWILIDGGNLLAAVLVVLGNVQAIILGRILLARNLVAKGKLRAEDVG
ncbi:MULTISPECIES: hypothetical protein [Micromonospora]|uniref:Uncharacterized protein n=1 Tax=Micromonospora gifhornensis TaxID=84594 RepID=A0ABQ4I8L7_9ACTN|nr:MULTISPECIES: hypothetical protein [Micromonospora]PMR58634.1 hypothetical protein C1A38_23755 [Verrucosispora sp. ts21]GIJ14234.1 hypothetical protein Vgi01_09180 [Micromonospora gifhornensis]